MANWNTLYIGRTSVVQDTTCHLLASSDLLNSAGQSEQCIVFKTNRLPDAHCVGSMRSSVAILVLPGLEGHQDGLKFLSPSAVTKNIGVIIKGEGVQRSTECFCPNITGISGLISTNTLLNKIL